MKLPFDTKYLVIPVFLVLVSLLGFAALNFSQGSIVPEDVSFEDNFTKGSEVTETLSVSTSVSPDTDYSDGSVRYIFAKHLVVKDGEVVTESDWVQQTGQQYSHEFSDTFSESGEYGYIVVLAEAESEYSRSAGAWTEYDITELDSENYFFKIESAPEPPSPDNSLQSFFQDIISSIFEVFGL